MEKLTTPSRRRKNKYAALFLGWLVPGLGHLYAGRPGKAFFFLTVIGASTATGWALGEFRNVYFTPDHYQFYAEIGNGLFTAAVSAAMWATRAYPIEFTARGGMLAGRLPVADLYLMLAGLLNMIVAANAYDTVALAGKKE